MPNYRWVCYSCGESNAAGTDSCQACAFPAMASGAEVDEAVSGVQRPPRPSRKELLKARREELAALPLWKKPFGYVLRSVQVIAALMFWACVLQLSVEGVLLGLAIGAVAEVLFQILKGKPYSWESP